MFTKCAQGYTANAIEKHFKECGYRNRDGQPIRVSLIYHVCAIQNTTESWNVRVRNTITYFRNSYRTSCGQKFAPYIKKTSVRLVARKRFTITSYPANLFAEIVSANGGNKRNVYDRRYTLLLFLLVQNAKENSLQQETYTKQFIEDLVIDTTAKS